MYYVRSVKIVALRGLLRDRTIKEITDRELANSFIVPKNRGDVISIVGDDGKHYDLMMSFVKYDYDVNWHDRREGAVEIIVYCKKL
jgi:hypothetical protein